MTREQAKKAGRLVASLEVLQELLKVVRKSTMDSVRFQEISAWKAEQDTGVGLGVDLVISKHVAITMLDFAEKEIISELKVLGVK